jgi:membrane fusion protein, heavy metal efflux system
MGGLLLSLAIGACQKETQPDDNASPSSAVVVDSISINEITLTKSQYKAIGIQLGNVTTETVSTEVKANGRVDLPPENRATVSLPVSGKIRYVKALPGQAVRKGELLATLESFEFIQLQQDYLQSTGQLTFLEKELERQRTLSAENVGARKNYEQAQANYESMKALTQSLATKLRILGLSTESLAKNGITSAARIVSPVNGFITVANINLGKEVTAGQELLEIIDKTHMHIELNVFEQDASAIQKGQSVRILQQNTPPLEAYVYLVGGMFEGEARTLNIHAHVRDEKRESDLIPGAYVNAYISTGSRQALTVPAEALVRKGEHGFIYIQEKNYEFRRIPVQIGTTARSGNTEITTSVNLIDKQLVVKGAYLIDAELAKRSEPEE